VTTSQRRTCTNGHDLPIDHTGLCPVCGSTGKHFFVDLGATVANRVSLNATREHEELRGTAYQKTFHRWRTRWPFLRLTVFVVCIFVFPFIGTLIAGWPGVALGIALAFASLLINPSEPPRLIERDHWHSG